LIQVKFFLKKNEHYLNHQCPGSRHSGHSSADRYQWASRPHFMILSGHDSVWVTKNVTALNPMLRRGSRQPSMNSGMVTLLRRSEPRGSARQSQPASVTNGICHRKKSAKTPANAALSPMSPMSAQTSCRPTCPSFAYVQFRARLLAINQLGNHFWSTFHTFLRAPLIINHFPNKLVHRSKARSGCGPSLRAVPIQESAGNQGRSR